MQLYTQTRDELIRCFILTYYYMLFKIALLLVLEKKRNVFVFLVRKYFEVVLSYENDFQNMHYDSKGDIQPDIHDVCSDFVT